MLFLGTVLGAVVVLPGVAGATGGEPGPHGKLIVEKQVEGDGPPQFGFNVSCEGDSTLHDRDFVVTVQNGSGSKTFDGVLTGALCTVKETDAGGADSTSVEPGDGRVVIGDTEPVTVRFVNVFEPKPTTTTAPAPTTTTTAAPTTTTTLPPTTTTTVPTAVLGATVTAPPPPTPTLPRTGSGRATPLTILGLVLVVAGAALRRRTRPSSGGSLPA